MFNHLAKQWSQESLASPKSQVNCIHIFLYGEQWLTADCQWEPCIVLHHKQTGILSLACLKHIASWSLRYVTAWVLMEHTAM